MSQAAAKRSHAPEQLEEWQTSLTGRRQHRFWEPALLDPPALLADVAVVLVSPKRPISIGTVARALSAFECEDLRIVEPRCDHLARSSRNASKGAQYLLWRSQHYEDLSSALADAEVSVAFTRWVAGRPGAFSSLAELLAAPQLVASVQAAPHSAVSGYSERAPASAELWIPAAVDSSQVAVAAVPAAAPPTAPRRKKLALVFGREEQGFDPEELGACDYTCSIPIGRLQESLSLSHAVSIALSQLFQLRQAGSGRKLPASMADLAEGFEDTGEER